MPIELFIHKVLQKKNYLTIYKNTCIYYSGKVFCHIFYLIFAFSFSQPLDQNIRKQTDVHNSEEIAKLQVQSKGVIYIKSGAKLFNADNSIYNAEIIDKNKSNTRNYKKNFRKKTPAKSVKENTEVRTPKTLYFYKNAAENVHRGKNEVNNLFSIIISNDHNKSAIATAIILVSNFLISVVLFVLINYLAPIHKKICNILRVRPPPIFLNRF